MESKLPEYIARLRDLKGWSTRELARRAKINYETVRKIETRETLNPGIQTIIDIANALNVLPTWLMIAQMGKDPDTDSIKDDNLAIQQAIDMLETLKRAGEAK